MRRLRAWTPRVLAIGSLAVAAGCASIDSPFPPGAYLRREVPPPSAVPTNPTSELPEPPPFDSPPRTDGARPDANPRLELDDVLASVRTNFPLLLAVEQERAIAAAQKLTAEGAFDTVLRARGSNGEGTFPNSRLDVGVEQPTPYSGATFFGGYRATSGEFPIYNNGLKTADGGEFRAGVTVPLLRDGPVDRRRVAVRQAQINERLADPTIRRAKLDYERAGAQSYWAWVAAGAQYRVAQEVSKLAQARQDVVDAEFKAERVGAAVPALNRRLVAGREEQAFAANRTLQAAALRLSLFYRDAAGNPVVPSAQQLPGDLIAKIIAPPDLNSLAAAIRDAQEVRPELVRFRLLRERLAVDLTLAQNQFRPTLNAFAAATQDVGFSKKTFTGDGPFKTDRTSAEMGLLFELPAQRRDALGRIREAQSRMVQVLQQERYAKDEIAAQVQDAVSELEQTKNRIAKARVEQQEAVRVRELETASFQAGRTSLVDLNIQEVAAAEAQVKVLNLIGAYFRAVAEYRAAIGSSD